MSDDDSIPPVEDEAWVGPADPIAEPDTDDEPVPENEDPDQSGRCV